jgi:phosphoribosylglycinamide formyltransferase-1
MSSLNKTLNLGFMASGRGSNMQAVIEACADGRLTAKPNLVISNNSQCGAMQRAQAAGIPHLHFSSQTHPQPTTLDEAICQAFQQHQIDLIILAGYMKKIGTQTLNAFQNRIINIHPALLPQYGGQGMYGLHVHTAVIEAGETETGVTVHLIDGEYDTGPILAQSSVPVLPHDTPQTLAQRVLAVEHQLLVETLIDIANHKISLPA